MSAGGSGAKTGQTGWLVLAIVAGNLLIDTVEVSSFFVALPTLVTHFGLSTTEIIVLSAAFPVAFAIAIPLAQPIAARVGAQALFVGALVAFAAFATVGAATSSVVMIAIARAVKGISAGLTTPLGNSVIGAAFASEVDRDRAGRVYSLTGGAGFIGGMAITAPLVMESWRAGISWTAPVAAVLAVAAATLLPRNVAPAAATVPAPPQAMRLVVIATVVVGALAVAPLAEWLRVAAGVAAVAIALAGFGIAARPALRHDAVRPFVINACTAGLFNALFLAFFATALLLLHRAGRSPIEASLVLCPIALGMACATPLTARVSRTLPPVPAITCAVASSTAAYVWFALDTSDDRVPGLGALFGMAALIGLAFVLGFVALNMRAVSFAAPELRGTALSRYQVLVQVGAALSIPVTAGLATTLGRAPVTGWPMIVAAGGIGLCCLTICAALATRSDRRVRP